ncbi:hypothetical protein [Acetobacter persici]|uniref:hypothetical protein n=1 Tax=Acetobacter persici TaxID=1076596 RepID=UPI0039EB2639
MVSKPLSALMEWSEAQQTNTSGSPPAPDTPELGGVNAAALIKELDFLSCEIVLKNGGPVIRGNKAAITPDLLDRLKATRADIVQHLTEQAASTSNDATMNAAPASPASLAGELEQSGIRRDPDTGKLFLFGGSDPRWLKEQGWEWNEQRRRFMAPFPQDREDPPPRFIITASPVKSDHRLHADGPCSLCGFTHWWREAGDTSESWTCSVCHPAPDGIATITPQTLFTQNSLDATA